MIAGTEYMPPPTDQPPELFARMIEEAEKIQDVYDRAVFYFLRMARSQFFYDVNKRAHCKWIGRFMMNGFLLQNGYPAINLPAKRQLEFNRLMLDFYSTGDQDAMNNFLRSCLDKKIINIMKENQIQGQAAHNH